jgi:hypothetical protein
MALLDALQDWRNRWRAAGVPDGTLRAGVREADVRAAIHFAPVHPDVITWFGWQDGPVEAFSVAPARREPLGLMQALAARDALEAAEEARGEENEFKDSWLPLLASWRGEHIYTDLETGVIYRHDFGLWSTAYPEWNLRIADDLESLVRIFVEVWDIVEPVWVPEDGVFDFDSSRAPADLFQRHVIG